MLPPYGRYFILNGHFVLNVAGHVRRWRIGEICTHHHHREDIPGSWYQAFQKTDERNSIAKEGSLPNA